MPTRLRKLVAGCADRRGMCRQDMRAFSVHMICRLGVLTGEGMSTGDESHYELKAGCADRRWGDGRRSMCRQDMRAFSVPMNCRKGGGGRGSRNETWHAYVLGYELHAMIVRLRIFGQEPDQLLRLASNTS